MPISLASGISIYILPYVPRRSLWEAVRVIYRVNRPNSDDLPLCSLHPKGGGPAGKRFDVGPSAQVMCKRNEEDEEYADSVGQWTASA